MVLEEALRVGLNPNWALSLFGSFPFFLFAPNPVPLQALHQSLGLPSSGALTAPGPLRCGKTQPSSLRLLVNPLTSNRKPEFLSFGDPLFSQVDRLIHYSNTAWPATLRPCILTQAFLFVSRRYTPGFLLGFTGQPLGAVTT